MGPFRAEAGVGLHLAGCFLIGHGVDDLLEQGGLIDDIADVLVQGCQVVVRLLAEEVKGQQIEARQPLSGAEVVRVAAQAQVFGRYPLFDDVRSPAKRPAGGFLGAEQFLGAVAAPGMFGQGDKEGIAEALRPVAGDAGPRNGDFINSAVFSGAVEKVARHRRGRVICQLI